MVKLELDDSIFFWSFVTVILSAISRITSTLSKTINPCDLWEEFSRDRKQRFFLIKYKKTLKIDTDVVLEFSLWMGTMKNMDFTLELVASQKL